MPEMPTNPKQTPKWGMNCTLGCDEESCPAAFACISSSRRREVSTRSAFKFAISLARLVAAETARASDSLSCSRRLRSLTSNFCLVILEGCARNYLVACFLNILWGIMVYCWLKLANQYLGIMINIIFGSLIPVKPTEVG